MIRTNRFARIALRIARATKNRGLSQRSARTPTVKTVRGTGAIKRGFLELERGPVPVTEPSAPGTGPSVPLTGPRFPVRGPFLLSNCRSQPGF